MKLVLKSARKFAIMCNIMCRFEDIGVFFNYAKSFKILLWKHKKQDGR